MVASLHTNKYEVLRNLLIEARKSRGLTQAELAKKLKRPQSFVSKYESGERRLDITELVEIANVMKANPNEILLDYIKKSAHF